MRVSDGESCEMAFSIRAGFLRTDRQRRIITDLRRKLAVTKVGLEITAARDAANKQLLHKPVDRRLKARPFEAEDEQPLARRTAETVYCFR